MFMTRRQPNRALTIAILTYGTTLFAQPPINWRSPAASDFLTSGGNLANQRFSSLIAISPSNISKLGGAWMIHVADGAIGANLEGTPVVVDGVMYLPGTAG